ncbi:MAG: YggS family pyridoxal phosphate-dependent enzyme [Acidobacteria bacterium]|nr:YggS family pyridoxal phosphate-dependent enzyme [Acidobacteriota bacterium]MCA1651178.1 YggS family pyridoxal phosphate-dependent enzyme [Acidobacteriota bacterium]
MTLHASIAANLADIRGRIAAAARRAERDAAGVTLVAVSKTYGAEHVRAAYATGQRDFGENKVQEALQKVGDTTDMADIRWHLIGHLQSNKAKKAAGPFACIQSVDSLDLLHRLDAAAGGQGTAFDVLVQVDLAGEATKFGAAEVDAEHLVRAALGARTVRLAGLMLVPPWSDDQEQTRPWFIKLREFRDALVRKDVPASALRHLSMGMSHDFEAAIEEGATMVRVGTAIFGKRTARA